MVVRHQSFTRAALDLFLSQPTVSGHIRALEDAFGVEIFDRGHQNARLTEAGRAVYAYAVSVLRETAAVRAQLSDLAVGRAGVITLAAGVTAGSHILPRLLAEFQHEHPGAQVRLRILARSTMIDEVLRGHVDFGIISESADLPTTSLEAEDLWLEPRVLVVRPDHPLAGRRRLSARDLAGQAFITSASPSPSERALDDALAQLGSEGRRIVMVSHSEGAKQAVLEGVGVAILFRRVVEAELASGELVELPLGEILVPEHFRLIRRSAHEFSPLARSLLAHLRAHAAGRREGRRSSK